MRKLGEVQKTVLAAISKSKVWHPGCRWVYGTPSETKRVLNSLVRIGLVSQDGSTYSLR